MPLFSKKLVPTTITSNIEKATDPSVTEVDWSLVIAICDTVNNTETGAKEARKLLQKKMLSSETQTQVLALELLDALLENCKNKFQSQLAAKSFAEDLDTLASSKTLDDRVHGKLAHCLQNWTTRFGSDPAFSGVQRAYEKLMRGAEAQQQRGGPGRLFRSGATQPSARQQPGQQQEPLPADPMGDVEVAKNNAQLFSQTLSFTDPTAEDISKNELIQEFHGKCSMFQRIISGHLETCNDPDVISALLEANAEIVSCFKAYDDMLERSALSEATANSKIVNERGTDLIQTDDGGAQAGASANPFRASASQTSSGPSQQQQPQQQQQTGIQHIPASEPFDPFSDINEAPDGQASSGDASHVNLPPPLIPQKMHD